jgi:BirA family biotin operon repressor/biotin-[acetyl-CoA-carboxylase] ligase
LPQDTNTKLIGFPFVELQSVDSTNNYARQQIHEGLAQHGTTYFAHEQRSGKGQRGRYWNSEKDTNIIMSVVINPRPILLAQQFMLSACVALAIHDFFRKYAGGDTKIKWPNDLYWQDRKAGGVLIESGVGSQESGVGNKESGVWNWSIAGMGININQTVFPSELTNPVSLKQITGKNFNEVELAKELCVYLEKYYLKLAGEDFGSIHELYVAQLYKKNSFVKLKKGSRVFEAMIKSVSPSGKLIVQHAIEEEFEFGEIEWLIK